MPGSCNSKKKKISEELTLYDGWDNIAQHFIMVPQQYDIYITQYRTPVLFKFV